MKRDAVQRVSNVDETYMLPRESQTDGTIGRGCLVPGREPASQTQRGTWNGNSRASSCASRAIESALTL